MVLDQEWKWVVLHHYTHETEIFTYFKYRIGIADISLNFIQIVSSELHYFPAQLITPAALLLLFFILVFPSPISNKVQNPGHPCPCGADWQMVAVADAAGFLLQRWLEGINEQGCVNDRKPGIWEHEEVKHSVSEESISWQPFILCFLSLEIGELQLRTTHYFSVNLKVIS